MPHEGMMINSFQSEDLNALLLDGMCPVDSSDPDSDLDPTNTTCENYDRKLPFYQCKNNCPGGEMIYNRSWKISFILVNFPVVATGAALIFSGATIGSSLAGPALAGALGILGQIMSSSWNLKFLDWRYWRKHGGSAVYVCWTNLLSKRKPMLYLANSEWKTWMSPILLILSHLCIFICKNPTFKL